MWNYEKMLQFPVNIKRPNAKAAQVIISQYGGPDGELGASLRYLSQNFAMPNRRVAGLLNDIGTEEHPPVPFLQGAEPLANLLPRHAIVQGCRDIPLDDEIEPLGLWGVGSGTADESPPGQLREQCIEFLQ